MGWNWRQVGENCLLLVGRGNNCWLETYMHHCFLFWELFFIFLARHHADLLFENVDLLTMSYSIVQNWCIPTFVSLCASPQIQDELMYQQWIRCTKHRLMMATKNDSDRVEFEKIGTPLPSLQLVNSCLETPWAEHLEESLPHMPVLTSWGILTTAG